MPRWNVEVGAELTRKQRAKLFGGADQGGIQPSRTTPNVFLYTDAKSGARYGYNFDGWDVDSDVIRFTGEGRTGHQRFTNGNRQVVNHAGDGRSLRLFAANGKTPGTNEKVHTYLGEFELDEEAPFFRSVGPDANKRDRMVIVFRLRPIGAFLRRSQEEGDFTQWTSPEAQLVDDSPSIDTVELEDFAAKTFARRSTEASTGIRRESDLVDRYRKVLLDADHVIKRLRIRPAGSAAAVWSDLLDTTTNELYEAKGVTTRNAVRLAIGQLLDYGRFASGASPVVLLPSKPEPDLLALLKALDIGCVYETSPGNFDRS